MQRLRLRASPMDRRLHRLQRLLHGLRRKIDLHTMERCHNTHISGISSHGTWRQQPHNMDDGPIQRRLNRTSVTLHPPPFFEISTKEGMKT